MDTNQPTADSMLEHADFLRALANQLVGNQADGEDLLQEAYLAALQMPKRSIRSPGRWLANVLRSKGRNQIRGELRRQDRERDVARMEALPSDGEVLERLESSKLLLAAVDALGTDQRRVIYMRYYEGHSIQHIARLEGLPIEAVRSRQRRALARLRESMDRGSALGRADWVQALLPLTGMGLVLPKAASSNAGNAIPLAAVLGSVIAMKKWSLVFLVGLLFLGGRMVLVGTPGERDALPEAASEEALQIKGADLKPGLLTGAKAGQREAHMGSDSAIGRESNSLSRITVKLQWEADGLPAVGVEALLYAFDSENVGMPIERSRKTQRARSDAGGQVIFADLQPGTFQIRAFRGGRKEVVLEAGASTHLSLLIPRGVDVQGVVLDPDGHPLAEAQVWLSREVNGWLAGSLATHTDARGRYEILSVEGALSVSARSDRYGPSVCIALGSKRSRHGEPLEISLQMRAEGGVLEGDVFDADGALLSNALVCAGFPGRFADQSNGRSARVGPPLMAQTDSEGHFRLAGVETGTRQLAVMADEHAILGAYVEVSVDAVSHCELHLKRGFSVEGVVRDARGNPVLGAIVQHAKAPHHPDVLKSFPAPITSSDESGYFLLKHLRANAFPLEARLVAYDQKLLAGAEGQLLTWNPTLSSEDEIRGRLLDGEGAPLVGWLVEALLEDTEAGTHSTLWANSELDGSFVIRVQPDGRYSLSARYAQTPDAVQRKSESLAKGISPSRDSIELRINIDKWSRIRGRIEDPAGLVGTQEILRVHALDMFTLILDQEVADGAFDIGPLPPGSYRLVFRVGSKTLHTSELLKLGGGDDLDLGTLVLPGAGSVRLSFTRDPGLKTDQSNIRVMLVDFVSMKGQGLGLQDGVYTSTEVLPGEYDLMVVSDDVTAYHPRVTVRAGRETSMQVHFEPAVNVRFQIDLKAVSQLPGGLNIRMEKVTGERYVDIRLGSTKDMPLLPFARALAKGHWRIILEHDSGARQTEELIISDLSQLPDQPIHLSFE